jgi:hypothetical protein
MEPMAKGVCYFNKDDVYVNEDFQNKMLLKAVFYHI